MVHQLAKVEKFESKCGEAIERFLRRLGYQSENTQANYRDSINVFLEKSLNKSITTVSFKDIEKIDYDLFSDTIDELRNGKKDNNSVVNRIISSVRSLIKELKGRKLINCDIDYLNIIKLLPANSVSIEPMPTSVINMYMNEASRELFNKDQKRLVIMLAADTALRLDDYVSMTWNQFTVEDNSVIIRGIGKGNKPYTEEISHEVYNQLLVLKQGNSEDSEVFAPLSRKNITDMMLRFKLRLGYEDREFSFHSLKKSAVTYVYRETGDILAAKKKGKHSNINTTENYIEAENYGATGIFSSAVKDDEAYKKLSHQELVDAIQMMNKDTVQIINIKVNEYLNKTN